MATKPKATLHHPKLKTTTTQPVAAARHLIEQGGWQLAAEGNSDEVRKALADVKPGYVGGDTGSKRAGGRQPVEPSGRAPKAATSSKAGGN